MSVALLLISDGRLDYLEQTRASIALSVPPVDHLVHVDDSAHELGFAGAVAEGWRRVLATDARWVLHVEQDFVFNRGVPLAAMTAALDAHPHLVQIALLRQPWNEEEARAGGIVQLHPDDYQPVVAPQGRWLEHRRHVTTNPAVWPRWVIERGWPETEQSEGRFGLELFATDPALRAAYWGEGEEWVRHLGDDRAGWGY